MNILLQIPPDAELRIKKGETVHIGDVLFEIIHQKTIHLSIAQKLGIKPKNIFHHLVKIIGEELHPGDLLAQKKGVLGNKKIYSEWNGTLKEINHETGEIVVIVNDIADGSQQSKQEIHAFVTGTVDDIEPTLLKIVVNADQSFEAKEVSADGGGETVYFADEGAYFTVTEDEIKNRIVIIENLKKHIVAKCDALGGKGYVCLVSDDEIKSPVAKLKNSDDFKKLVELKKKYVVFSKVGKCVAVYN